MTAIAAAFAITGLVLQIRATYLTYKGEWSSALQWSTFTTIAFIFAYLTKP